MMINDTKEFRLLLYHCTTFHLVSIYRQLPMREKERKGKENKSNMRT